MILNCKKALFIISCEEALDFYNYDKEKDILSLEVINKDICYLETEYERTNSDCSDVCQYFVINIPKQQYDKLTYKVFTAKKRTPTDIMDEAIEIIHTQELTNDDIIISLQEKLVIKKYVEKWYNSKEKKKNKKDKN